MRHGEGKEEARELYCYQQMTFEEIAERVGRTEKTIRSWANADGWRQKRDDEIKSQANTREKLQKLVDVITDRMINDISDGKDISPQSIHAVTNLVSATKNLCAVENKVKDAELAAAPEAQLSPEEIAKRVAEIMGA